MKHVYTIEVLNPETGEKLMLRVREPLPNQNVNGSILLLSERGNAFECVRCFEREKTKYTEYMWYTKLKNVYDEFRDDKDLRRMTKKRNDNPSYFAYARPKDHVYNTNLNYCKLLNHSMMKGATVSRFVWNAAEESMELQFEKVIDPVEDEVVGAIQYLDFYLEFCNVFDGTAAGKRARA